jgi:two-component system invasion response regulator UvrY
MMNEPPRRRGAAPKIRVLLADDHAIVRFGFKLLLQGTDDIDVVAEIDVVVIDLSMPGMGGIEAVKRILARDPRARILVLSAHEDALHPKRLLRAGALGYLTKRTAPEALIEAIHAVALGQPYVDARLAQRLAIAQFDAGGDPVERLSEREFEIFVQLAHGRSVIQVAEAHNLAPSTVGTHLYNIKQKLGAGNQAELTLIAIRRGLIEV